MVLSGPFALAAALLAVGGAVKVITPGPAAAALAALRLPSSPLAARVLGAGELAVGAAALALGGRWLAVAVGLCYLGFSMFVVVALRRGVELRSCGCFGQSDAPPSMAHLVIDAAAAMVAFSAAALGPPPPVLSLLAAQPLGGVPFLVFLGAGVYLLILAMTELPRLRHARSGS
jgi:hypothetical protein